jgi:hypothetical protein
MSKCIHLFHSQSERIVDTLEFFPHSYQMPQLSSTNRLIMAAKDMTDALQNPHPAVLFAHVGDDTILALADLAAVLKLKLRQIPSPTPQVAPPKVTQRPCLAESSNQILNSPMPISRQTRSQTMTQTQDISNAQLPPRVVTPRTLNPSPLRVVTPRTLNPSPPRVPTRSQRLSPQNLSQNDFCGMDTAHMAIALGDNHWSQQHQSNAVIHPVTWERNGIHGTYEGSPTTTALDARIWKRRRTPIPRHSGHSGNRHMFLYQTH